MKLSGHAVVLVGCGPNYLKFMNSWGEKFGEEGFFKVRDAKVLPKMKFYDVYWTKKDLLPCEEKAFKIESARLTTKYLKETESICKLEYLCPKCGTISKVKDFTGHILEFLCPLCRQAFKVDHKGIMRSLDINALNNN